ncbi:MAG: JAB domain-containing protein [Flavobacteriales bacterium]
MKNSHHPIRIKLSYHPILDHSLNPKLKSSQDAFDYIFPLWNYDTLALKEEFKVLFLNRNNAVLGFHDVSVGGISSCSVDIKIVFSLALGCGASGILLVHNHPSQSAHVSDEDLKLTSKIQQAAKLFEITVFDHIIICSEDSFLSMADENILPIV